MSRSSLTSEILNFNICNLFLSCSLLWLRPIDSKWRKKIRNTHTHTDISYVYTCKNEWNSIQSRLNVYAMTKIRRVAFCVFVHSSGSRTAASNSSLWMTFLKWNIFINKTEHSTSFTSHASNPSAKAAY